MRGNQDVTNAIKNEVKNKHISHKHKSIVDNAAKQKKKKRYKHDRLQAHLKKMQHYYDVLKNTRTNSKETESTEATNSWEIKGI